MRAPLRPGSWGLPLAVASGVLALAVRAPSPEAVFVTTGVGAVGGITPTPAAARYGERLSWLWAVVLGVAPFAVFAAWFRPLPVRGGWIVVATGSVAAVAEELFFRRLVYGWLRRWGPAVAVAGAAIAFAAVHVPAYGPGVLPVDLAAGLVFGWQRWSSGTWTAPATTHVLANLLALVALR